MKTAQNLKISLLAAAFTFSSLLAQAQLNQTPVTELAPTPAPVAQPAPPIVGQNLPPAAPLEKASPVNQPAVPAQAPAAQTPPGYVPPIQYTGKPVDVPKGWQPRTTAPVFSETQNPVTLPVQPKGPDVVNLPPGVQAPAVEKFVPSEVVMAPSSASKVPTLRAVLRTSMGDITLKLDRINAPRTVAQFVSLARGEKEFTDVKTGKPAKRPFYNGLIFHRVVKGTLIQTGDPFGTGRGDAGAIAPLPDEIKPNMKFSKPGLVAMAPMRDPTGTSLVKNSNNSQFFITLREAPEWDKDNQFTIFGEVEDGMDVVQKIANSKVGPTERPIKKVFLIAVEIIEN